MCGIIGAYGKSYYKKVRSASEFIKHRGPDSTGFFKDEEVWKCLPRWMNNGLQKA